MEEVTVEVMEERQQLIAERLRSLRNEFDRCDYLISVGCFAENVEEGGIQEEHSLEKELYRDENLIKTCQSKLWVLAQKRNGKLSVKVDSDSMMVRGIAMLLASVWEGATPEEAAKVNIWIIEHMGLGNLLSAKRKSGLRELIDKIQNQYKN